MSFDSEGRLLTFSLQTSSCTLARVWLERPSHSTSELGTGLAMLTAVEGLLRMLLYGVLDNYCALIPAAV